MDSPARNSLSNTVDPAIIGYSAFNHDVSIFEFAEVVVAKNYRELDRVRLVSGGTCSHIQYVGKGMLTASVQGSGLHSPTSSAILRTLRELSLNHVKGIVVVVQASSTDILNFGLAVERANNDDLRVKFIGVADDCKNKELTKADKRGLSGVLLVNKVAGALAESNKPLNFLYKYCKQVADNMISDSININKMLVTRECLYCQRCALEIVDAKSRRKSILKKLSFIDIVSDVISSLFGNIISNNNYFLKPEESVVLLVNNMGALTSKEGYLFVKEITKYLNKLNVKIVRFYIGPYLNLNYDVDLTLTVLKVFDEGLLPLLDYPCGVPGWITVCQSAPFISLDTTIPGCLKRKCRLSPPTKGPRLSERASNIVQLCIQFACDALISCERMLNKMDSEQGQVTDGDTGTRLKNVAEVVNRRICAKKLHIVCPFTLFLSLSKLLEHSVGGTMACIYCIIFEAAANKFGEYKEGDEVTAVMWVEALENACAAVKKYGNVEEGDKTMYDPLKACATTIRQNMTKRSIIRPFGLGVARAEEVAQLTKKAGHKYPDAGAHSVGIWLRAVFEGVKLKLFE